MIEKLSHMLDRLWATEITKHEIDLLGRKIFFELLSVDNGKEECFLVLFEEVSAVYYVKDSGEERLEFNDAEILECTSIQYAAKEKREQIKIVSKSEDDWVNQYYSEENFAIEIWNALLLIEANSITINGEKFDNLI